MTLYLNGEYLPIGQGRVSVEDRGFQFGDGVYEVMRAYGGKVFRMGRHLDRLERSLAFLQVPLPEPRAKIEEVCRRLLGELKDATIYLQVTRGAAPRVHAFPKDIRPTMVGYARRYQADPPDRTWRLLSVTDDRWAHCDIKTICLLPNALAKQKAVQAGCDEALFVREDGTVTEGCTTNAFLVRGGAMVTHPADPRVLHGITREAAIELARELGIPLLEQRFALREALEADEFFMTGTGIHAMPVVSIDGRKIGAGTAGPVTQRLRAAFDDLVRRELSS
ncbi:MAG TPA: D-amino acid aminotransferase [Planctomycetota bacterium]|nr:D-amino acid aminotransferase [Planctomycetota bacterium]